MVWKLLKLFAFAYALVQPRSRVALMQGQKSSANEMGLEEMQVTLYHP